MSVNLEMFLCVLSWQILSIMHFKREKKKTKIAVAELLLNQTDYLVTEIFMGVQIIEYHFQKFLSFHVSHEQKHDKNL